MRNPFSRITKNARVAIKHSAVISDRMGADTVEVSHLLIALLLVKEGIASRVLSTMDIDVAETVKSLSGDVNLSRVAVSKVPGGKGVSLSVRDVINKAFDVARSSNHVYVGTEHLLLAILEDSDSDIVKELISAGLKVDQVKKNLFTFTTYPKGLLSKPPKGQLVGRPTALDIFSSDLTLLAAKRKLDPLVGRDEELDRVINVLCRRRKNNPVIVGEAGVGKTALVEGLAQKIVKGEVPESLRNFRILSLDVTSILAGSKMRGDMEEKMMAVIKELSENANVILFIDEIHTILGVGMTSGGGLDLAGVLKPALVHGGFRCVGATTAADYNRYFEEDPALSRRFQKVLIEEDSVEDSILILKRLRNALEHHHNVVISDDAIQYAVRLSDQYVSDRYLPDKAIDLMDEAAAARRIELEDKYSELGDARQEYGKLLKAKEGAMSKGDYDAASSFRRKGEKVKSVISDIKKKRVRITKSKRYHVNPEIVRKIVSRWTGIPLTTLGSSESSDLIRLENTIGDYVVGQIEAVQKVSDAIKRARTGVTSGDRPWASFLFLGPTGVGKTELAKVLTRVLFGDDDRLIQIDMSEMMEMHSVSKLVGSPPGYVGYREGGQLTEKVRRHPHSVILFDEIEKAHIDVLNLLLQILEYGHLTDSKGRRVNFKNTVIILTSNIGADEIKKDRVLGFEAGDVKKNRKDREIEKAYDGMKDILEKELKDTLPPELINRLDDIIIFRSLIRKDAGKIVDLLLDDLNSRLKPQRVSVSLDSTSKDFIVKRGFSEEYGARPLRRTIQEFVETPVASYLLRYGGGVVVKGEAPKSKAKKLRVTFSKKLDKLIVTKQK
ncbi:MAG: ATP-dependent Clp protease ATP-binding subunit [Patescibacteria group bacterium]|nr:ATP-dependent Clp protease ATP-binding subunit [Patescibacteria group bacterium]